MMGFVLGNWQINESSLWCLLGGLIGMWVLVKRLHILNGNINTKMSDAFPVLLGTLAWLTAAFTFYTTGFDSPIDTQRVFMIVSWGMLAARISVSDFTKRTIFKK